MAIGNNAIKTNLYTCIATVHGVSGPGEIPWDEPSELPQIYVRVYQVLFILEVSGIRQWDNKT